MDFFVENLIIYNHNITYKLKLLADYQSIITIKKNYYLKITDGKSII